ncbi:hypothetical protein ABPG72_016416 [Tetrahymena utriculariae]
MQNQKVYLIWILVDFSLTYAQIIYTDEVPFVFYSTLQVFPVLSSIVDYSSKFFKSEPVPNASKTSCQITSLNDMGIDGLNVSKLAIDKTNFPNIQIIKKTKSNIFQNKNNLLEEEVIEFPQFIQQANGSKQAIVILNGQDTKAGQFSISIITLTNNDQYYKIQINNIYNILSYCDTSLSDIPQQNCLFSNCPDRHVKSQFQIPTIQNIQIPQEGYQNIFLAFNKLEYLVTGLTLFVPFIELSTYSIQTNGQFSFSYFVKNRSKFTGVMSTAKYFYQKKCLQSNQKLQGNQCINDCIQRCVKNNEPSSSYTCYPEKNYQTCEICNSIQNCLKCKKNLNQLQCVQCEQNYYVYKGVCQVSVSSSNSVSNTAQAAVAISVTSSTTGSNYIFLTLQKLNLLYMINILMTSKLTTFINQIKGTNPLSYFQYINFVNKHIFIESFEQLINQQITDKEFQTSLVVNGGDILISIENSSSYISNDMEYLVLGVYQQKYNQTLKNEDQKIKEKKTKIPEYQLNAQLSYSYSNIKQYKLSKSDVKQTSNLRKKEDDITNSIQIRIFTNVSLTQAQIIYTDEVPFVFYGNLQVFPAPPSSIIDYSSKQFQAEPVIIVGIQNYHYKMSSQVVPFKLQVSKASKSSCQIESLDNIGIEGLNVSTLAIDQTNFPYIQVIQKTSQNLFQGSTSNSLQEEEVIEFSQLIQKANGKKEVIVFLNGWNSKTALLSISINTLIMNDQYYKIQINRQLNCKITSVTYTIIEYISDSENNIYNILSYYDSSLSKISDTTNCLYSQCSDRHVYSQFQIPNIQNIQTPQQGYQHIFLAFNKFDYTVIAQNDFTPSIELSTYSIQTNGQFSFSYFVKNKSRFSGVTSTAIFFYQKKYLQSKQKLQGNQCINDCVNINPIQPLFCLDCQSGQYFLQDLKVCQYNEPSSSQTFYKGVCQVSVSSSNSVSNTAKAAVAISVISSTQGSNFMLLTLQKLNLLYMTNILMTSELTILIDQLKGTNPLSYFQSINFFTKKIFIESSEQLIDQQITNKEFQTSLLVNG